MKKVLCAITACLMMLAVMTSCGMDSSDPRSVAEAATQCLKNKDVEGYLKLTNATPEQQEQFAALAKEKRLKEMDEKGGIDHFEVGEPKINEEKGTARVVVKTFYGNGTDEEKSMNMKKDDNGDWKLDVGK